MKRVFVTIVFFVFCIVSAYSQTYRTHVYGTPDEFKVNDRGGFEFTFGSLLDAQGTVTVDKEYLDSFRDVLGKINEKCEKWVQTADSLGLENFEKELPYEITGFKLSWFDNKKVTNSGSCNKYVSSKVKFSYTSRKGAVSNYKRVEIELIHVTVNHFLNKERECVATCKVSLAQLSSLVEQMSNEGINALKNQQDKDAQEKKKIDSMFD